MRVWLDGLPLLTPHRGGVGNYCYNLLHELNKLADVNAGVFYNKSCLQWAPKMEGGTFSSRFPYRGIQRIGGWRCLDFFPLERLGLNGDIYHGTDASLLPSTNMKKVVTVHDLEIVSHPQTTTSKNREKRLAALQYALKKADAVITVSEYTKQDVLTQFPQLKIPVFAIPLAADSSYTMCTNLKKMDDVRKKYGIPEKYILFVGGNYPRKNLDGMLKAFGKAKQLGIQEKFVLVGGHISDNNQILELIQEQNLTQEIVIPGFVEQADLPLIYQMATLFMHVSYFEGFGLPVLEAMRCGTPAMVSDRTSLPEVVGDCGIIVNPEDIEKMGIKLAEVLGDFEKLVQLAEAAHYRALSFSWKKTAQETVRVYEYILQSN